MKLYICYYSYTCRGTHESGTAVVKAECKHVALGCMLQKYLVTRAEEWSIEELNIEDLKDYKVFEIEGYFGD